MGGVSVQLLFKSDTHNERKGKEEQAGITDKKMTLTVYCRELSFRQNIAFALLNSVAKVTHKRTTHDWDR